MTKTKYSSLSLSRGRGGSWKGVLWEGWVTPSLQIWFYEDCSVGCDSEWHGDMWGTDIVTHCHPHIIVTPQVSIILQDGAPSNSESPASLMKYRMSWGSWKLEIKTGYLWWSAMYSHSLSSSFGLLQGSRELEKAQGWSSWKNATQSYFISDSFFCFLDRTPSTNCFPACV